MPYFLCVGESGNSIEQEERGEEDLKGCGETGERA